FSLAGILNKRTLIVTTVVFLLLYFLTNCTRQSTIEDNNLVNLNYNVSVNKNIELLTVIQYLADFDLKYEGGHIIAEEKESIYRDNVKKHFAEYREHPAVVLYEEMVNYGFAFDTSTRFMLYVDDNLEFKDPNIEKTLAMEEKEKWGGFEKGQKFLIALKEFESDTNFNDFYKESLEIYNQFVYDFETKIPLKNMIELLVTFYGYNHDSYNIIITPLSPSGKGPYIENSNSGLEAYCICVPIDNLTNPVEMVIHEFSHSYINPLAFKNSYPILKASHLLEPISEEMKLISYGSWMTVAIEHIVRASTARIIYHLEGQESAAQELEKQINKGFIYIEPIYNKLIEYEKNRNIYPTIDEFFSEIISIFRRLAK
ncbi:MAG: DUF4932 domain-containing protein, partial [Firmicutes bacterium]|nr:DUF4932 domain-containing protein [Bacillota bacterium]